jgi:site-specific DNA-methyltransferase (adenine-specific)
MQELPDNSVHLMVTSPPYNVGKDYDEDMTEAEYRDFLRDVWQETYRVLVHGGRACINVANLGRRPYVPLSTYITQDMIEVGFLMRGQIIWNKQASAGSSCAWGSWRSPSNPVLRDVHEYILVFCKGDFARKKPECDQKRATISKEDFLAWTKSVWQFPAESARKVKHPAPYPVDLPARCIQLYTYSNDVVLDPFIGSGTTAVAAQEAGRKWIGYEVSPEYVALSFQRLEMQLGAE